MKKNLRKRLLSLLLVLTMLCINPTGLSVAAEGTDLGLENYALTAEVTTNVASDSYGDLGYIKDNVYTNSVARYAATVEAIKGDYYQFNWSSPITVNKVILWNQHSGQAPTGWKIQVSTDGADNWKDVSEISGAVWPGQDLVSRELVFETQSDIKGLRVYITDANLEWGHYTIYELQIENDPNASLTKQEVKKLTGLKIEGGELVEAFDPDDNDRYIQAKAKVGATSVKIIPTADDDTRIFIDGSEVQSGEPFELKLKEEGYGYSTVTIQPASKDGYCQKSFTLAVLKPAPDTETLYTTGIRPQFHYTAPYGFINDPNGMMYNAETGEYQFFYQAYPYSLEGDSKHWGWATTSDLVHFEEQNTALYPDNNGDMWSGSGIIDYNNVAGLYDESTPAAARMVLIYYAWDSEGTSAGLACYDYEKEIWVKAHNGEQCTFVGRQPGHLDPKVFWYEKENTWIMMTASGLLYTSDDLWTWTFNSEDTGWECPDLYQIQVEGSDEVKWVRTYGGSFYRVGDLVKGEDGTIKFVAESENLLYNGDSFKNGSSIEIDGWTAGNEGVLYATQHYKEAKDGRIIAVSWLRENYRKKLDSSETWTGMMSVAMEQKLYKKEDDTYILYSYPVEEIKTLRDRQICSVNNLTVTPGGNNILEGVTAALADIDGSFTLDENVTEFGFKLRTGVDGGYITIKYDAANQMLTADYSHSGDNTYNGVRTMKMELPEDRTVSMRILLDNIVVESFGNDGEAAISSVYYRDESYKPCRGMEFFTVGGNVTINSLDIYSMKESWKEASDDTNYALAADVTTNAGSYEGLDYINDDVYTNSVARHATTVEGIKGDYYQFNWSSPITVNKIILWNQYSGQAPTGWKIQVSEDGVSDWKDVGEISDVVWPDTDLASKELVFEAQSNIKGLRVCVTDANLEWGHYTIYELEIKYAPDANYALAADVTTNADSYGDLDYINDGVHTNSVGRSAKTVEEIKDDYYQFNWSSPITVNKVILWNQYSGQAPTGWKIQVSEDGVSDWKDVSGISGAVWSENGLASKELVFEPQSNIKGLRLCITDANLEWGHYTIYELEIKYDPDAKITELETTKNYAYNAAVSTNVESDDWLIQTLPKLNDGVHNNVVQNDVVVYNAGAWRTGWPADTDSKDYYQFTWANPVSVNQVVLAANKTDKQAPTAWHVEVSTDGTNWTKVASVSGVEWKYSWSDTIETKKLTFALQENILGLRVYIDEANLDWNGYAIQEIEVYNDPVSVSGYTATLEGNIGLNFFLNLSLSDEEKNSDATYIHFMVPGEEDQKIALNALGESEITANGCKFTCNVPAKKMADTITAKFYVNGQLYPETYEYSVAEYAKTIANDTSNTYASSARELAGNMLHYGAYSQQYFGYHTENLANKDLAELDLSSVTVDSFKDIVGGNALTVEELGTNKASNLILESETTLKLYFKPADGVSADSLTFTYKDKELETSPYKYNNETWICIPVTNIAAHELGNTINITVSNGSVDGILSYSALTYGYNVLKNEKYNDRTDLQNLVKALYLYYQAAVNYNSVQKTGYVLAWNDEFNGTELNTESWLPQYLPHVTTSSDGAAAKYTVANGNLKLYIDENSVDYYSGSEGGFRVSSIQTYEKNGLHTGANNSNETNRRSVDPFNGYVTQYGYFEMRCKIPSCGGGGAVAWWMIGTQYDAREDGTGSKQNGEIDIIETWYSDTNTVWPKVHPQNDPDLIEWTDAKKTLEGDYVNEYHTYAMDWTPDYLAFYVDGVEIGRTNQSPQYEMCMLLSMYTSSYEDYWAGGSASDVYPKEWEIDYVRVYKDANGYPNAQTKPAEPDLSNVEKISSEAYTADGDPAEALGITDLARNATVTTATENYSQGDALESINSSEFYKNWGWCSKDNPTLPAEFTFTWDTQQNVDTLNLYTKYAADQGITWVELQIQKAGSEVWTTVAEYQIEWILGSGIEYAKMAVPDGEGITGLRFIVHGADMTWNHYVFQGIHIYKSNN